MCRKLICLIYFVLVLCLVETSTAQNIDPSLVAWYRFDGNALDSSGNDLHGTEMGNPTYEAGVFGQAISLDGYGDYVDCGLAPEFDITDEITFTYWIKVFAFDKGWDTVLSKGDDSWRSSRAGFNNFMEAAVNGTTGGYTYGVTPVDDDQWHHVGFVYDGTMNYLYVDGEVDASEPSTGQIDVSSYPLCIGANSQHLGEGWSSCWNGLIDDVQIYNRALSQEEVQIIMQSSAGEYPQARGAYLAAYWDGNYGTAWAGGGEGTRDALEAEGYEILDAVALKTWMDARIADGGASVVVFCRDAVPDTVAESMSATCTLRQYLDAGGKIVWYGDIPFWHLASAGAGNTTWGDAGAPAILGFDTSGAPRGSWNDVTLTTEGIEWGLTETWQSERPASTSVVASENLTVLATDNAGNAAAWVKHYVPGDDSRGFVRFRDTGGQANVDDIMRVAEYGLWGNPYARRPNPADGAVHADTWASMSWFAGDFAVSHDVYFSDNFDDVEAGTKDTFQGNQTATYFAVGSARSPYLVPGVTYYWRVDEVEEDGTIHTGDVWSFSILPEISITDLSIVGWWRFDEGYGTTVSDSSGYGNHGTFGPQPYDPQWVPGMFGYALEFDGDDYVDVGNSSTLNFGIDNWTVTGWVKTTMGTGSSGILFGNGGAQSGGIRYTLQVKGTACLITDDDSTKVELKGSTSVADDVWHHLAGVRDGTTLFVYVDGELDGTDTLADGYDLSGTAQHNAYIGAVIDNRSGSLTMHLVGLIDDVCVFSKALTEDEIVRVMKGEVVTARFQAFNPNPPDGATDVPWDDVVLGWIPGDYADKHDVYFGTNFNDVNDADRTNPLGVLVSQDQVPDSYSIAEVLQWEKTYYWRVDEIEADGVTIHKGDIWSFSIPPKTASVLGHFAITYYDNYNYDTEQWDAWQSAATPRDAWDDKYLADGLSGNTVYTDYAFTSIAVFNLRGNLFSKDGHASHGEDWNPLQSIGDNVSGQSAHHVFAALFKGLIYLEEGDVLMGGKRR